MAGWWFVISRMQYIAGGTCIVGAIGCQWPASG
jgi:hypothetical protein